MNKKRVFITGVAGYGGSSLARELLARGHYVSGIDILAPNEVIRAKDLMDNPNFKYNWGSVHDMTPKDFEDQDVVVHMAAQADVPMGFPAPAWTGWENVLGTLHVLEAVKKVKIEKFILASSGNVFGRPKYTPIDTKHPLTPHNPYSASKACQELYAEAYRRSYKVPVVIMRNGIVYGPRMRKQIFVYIWLKEILKGNPITIEGGEQTRDPNFGGDTVKSWVQTVEAEPSKVVGRAFQVSAGKEYKMMEIAKACMKAAGKEVPIKSAPYRPGEEGQRECFDITDATEILGYKPEFTLEQGLAETVKWVKEEEGL